MYVPKPFQVEDRAALTAFMARYGFAVLVTAGEDGVPVANHLPLLYRPQGGPIGGTAGGPIKSAAGTLVGHMARANPQWKDFAKLEAEGIDALVAFQGPHAYISPNWYGPGRTVPTWNYLAIHAYGRPRIIDDPGRVRALIEQLVETQESAFAQSWSMASQDEAYNARLLSGIVAFEIPLTRIEAKAKLNQNKSPDQRQGVIAALNASGDPRAAELAALMTAMAPEE